MSMNWLHELKHRTRSRKTRSIRKDSRAVRPSFEPLENRVVLSVTISVTTTSDTIDSTDGETSLREAINQANAVPASEAVTINLAFDGATYSIQRDTYAYVPGSGFIDTESRSLDPDYGDFDIRRSMTINGNESTIRVERLGRAFQISGGSTVEINALRIINGGDRVSEGGGMAIGGGSDVTLNNVTFFNNETGRSGFATGGAIYADNAGGTIVINGGEFSSNLALGGDGASDGAGGSAFGGAIYLNGGRLEINDTKFHSNDARGGDGGSPGESGGAASGGAIYVETGDLIIGSTFGTGPAFEENSAEGGDGVAGDEGGAGAPGRGGAIFYGGGGVLDIRSTRFDGNQAEGGTGSPTSLIEFAGGAGGNAYGGALFLGPRKLDVSISDSEFRSNWAFAGSGKTNEASVIHGGRGGDAKGGAIATAESPFNAADRLTSTLTVSRSAFDENQADGGDGGLAAADFGGFIPGVGGKGGDAWGGAVYASYGSVDLLDNAFRTNRAMAGDGGYVDTGLGGDGGSAGGGAVFTTAWATLSIHGTIAVQGPPDDPDELTATSLMLGNTAIGGSGGSMTSVV